MEDSENLPATQGLSPSDEDSQESFSQLHPPKIGRYSILRRLGKGGFGEVFLAFDEELDRPVAIKVPRPERVSQPEDVEAYFAEARIVAGLDHPHIVPVYDVGRTENGLCFVVSKCIEGSDLATRIKEARFSFHESAGLVATDAEALHYAHTTGLVHRDIKPANILIDGSGKALGRSLRYRPRPDGAGRVRARIRETTGRNRQGTEGFLASGRVRTCSVEGKGRVQCAGVICVEMMKSKAWTPATLKEVGGTEGIGLTFLEETFCARTAPPRHRYHQEAARAILRALLPGPGSDIRGAMRSRAELLEASSHAGRLRDFDDLIHILDSELRLITPADPEGEQRDPVARGCERRDEIR